MKKKLLAALIPLLMLTGCGSKPEDATGEPDIEPVVAPAFEETAQALQNYFESRGDTVKKSEMTVNDNTVYVLNIQTLCVPKGEISVHIIPNEDDPEKLERVSMFLFEAREAKELIVDAQLVETFHLDEMLFDVYKVISHRTETGFNNETFASMIDSIINKIKDIPETTIRVNGGYLLDCPLVAELDYDSGDGSNWQLIARYRFDTGSFCKGN